MTALRSGVRFALAVAALAVAACNPQPGEPDLHGFPHDGPVTFDGSGCLGGHCYFDGSWDMPFDAADAGASGDAAPFDADVDADFDSGIVPPPCVPGESTDRVTVSAPSTPFVVGGEFAGWRTDTPCPQVLDVVLTESPMCDDTRQQLVIELSKSGLDGALAPGSYTVTGGAASFAIGYWRPAPLMPSGVFGPCVSATSLSQITFDTLNYTTGTRRISGSLDVSLVDCTSPTMTPFQIQANFDVAVDPLVAASPPVCM